MPISRRTFVAASSIGAATSASAQTAQAASGSTGLDAAAFGVRAGAAEDQTAALQRAIDRAAQARMPLLLPPGLYRCGELRLPAQTKIVGTRGATRLELAYPTALLASHGADHITLHGLVLDGGKRRLPERRALVHLVQGAALRLTECEILNAGRNGLTLERMEGIVADCTIEDAADTALFALDSRGLRISGNTVRRAGNNGIQVWRSTPGDDGTIVTDNRIEDTRADSGGTGQYGNAINVYRAGNVLVRGNRIQGAAFSAVRGNSASNIQITGNSCSRLGEVAIYSEFAFEGAVIANNTVDGATVGISVTNFNEGGRLAVVQGNLLRNLGPAEPGKGIGIAIEADTAVTGNVIENAPTMGIVAGYGAYLRDVVISSNILRGAGIGIAVSVSQGAGTTLVSDNLIADASIAAIAGMDQTRRVTGDLAKEAGRYAHLTLSGNRVR